MSSSNLIRLSGLAAVLGGVLFLVGGLLSLATETEDFRRGEWATTTPYLVTWSLFLLGGVLLLIGLVGLYVRQSEAAGHLRALGLRRGLLGHGAGGGRHLVPTLHHPVPGGRGSPGPARGGTTYRRPPRRRLLVLDVIREFFSFGLVFVRFYRSESPGLPASGRHSPHSRGAAYLATRIGQRNRP